MSRAGGPSPLPPRVADIVRQVAHDHGVPAAQLVAPYVAGQRDPPITAARWAAMRRVRALVLPHGKPPSYPQIGRWFGGRDHSTVINAVRGGQ